MYFSASVTGPTDAKIMWSIQEATSGGAISADGTYQAPAAPGNYYRKTEVVATQPLGFTSGRSLATG